MGPAFVVVKKGEHGCVFIHREGMGALPAYPAEEVVDPTGAGDTFAGGMMGYVAAQAAKGARPDDIDLIRRSLAHGTVMASFNIEAFSLERLTRLTRDEISARYDEFGRMLDVR
jgi:sugar/nucleoside kinase (ribokinase family)